MNPGGALTLINSQVARGVAANAPGFLMICGSQLSSVRPNPALGVSNATGAHPDRGCRPRLWRQPHRRQRRPAHNTAPTFGNNVVGGSVTVNDGGPGSTILRSNNITGTMACFNNDPPPRPTRPVERNTAGARAGQCVGNV